MKIIVNLLRILVGLLFIFSGLIKSNDPTGFSYKLDEYFTVFADDLSAKQDSLDLTISTLDGENNYKQAILSDLNSLQLIASNSPWVEIELDEETSLNISTANIQFAGQPIEEYELNASEGDSIVHEVQYRVSLGSRILQEGNFEFINGKQDAVKIEIPTQEYAKSNSWIVGFLDSLRDYALALAIFICVVEIILGIALLIGWAPKFTIWMLLLMILFFTFLTWYSAQFDKVTDCGCFGDAIKLTPWQSFNKDLILLIAVLIIWFGMRYVKPIFSNPFSVRLLTVFTLASTALSLYCWHYLPVKNFLKFKEGADIRKQMQVPDGGRETDHVVREYIYDDNGEEVKVVWDSDDNSFTPNIDKAWTFLRVGDEKVLEKRDEPPIHDFKIMDETQSADYVEDFFNGHRWKIMIVMNDLDKSDIGSMDRLKELITAWKEAGHEIYPLTASESSQVEEFRHEHQLDVPFYYGDKTNLKSIIRSNPGLVLVDSTTVVKTWPSTRLPKAKRLLKFTK